MSRKRPSSARSRSRSAESTEPDIWYIRENAGALLCALIRPTVTWWRSRRRRRLGGAGCGPRTPGRRGGVGAHERVGSIPLVLRLGVEPVDVADPPGQPAEHLLVGSRYSAECRPVAREGSIIPDTRPPSMMRCLALMR